MSTAPVSTERPEAPLFSDGLGDRVVSVDGASRDLLQILRIRPAVTAVPSFEFALRERTARLANFRHAYFARVRRIDRVQVPAPGLAIVSDHVEGTRLSELLRVAQERQLSLDINTALCLVRQLVPAVALLHENARDVAHGLLSPERIIVTPHARLVIVEHVLGAALEQLQYTRDRLWQEFRVGVPASAGVPRFDHRADVTGIGLVALSLVLGRPLQADEFPHQLPALLTSARERTGPGEDQPLSAPLRDWIARALQLDARRAFASAPEAQVALEGAIGDDSGYTVAPVALETFLSRYAAALLEPAPQEPAPWSPVSPIPVTPVTPVPPSPPPTWIPAPSLPHRGMLVQEPPARPAVDVLPRPAVEPIPDVAGNEDEDEELTRESIYTKVPRRNQAATASPAAPIQPPAPAPIPTPIPAPEPIALSPAPEPPKPPADEILRAAIADLQAPPAPVAAPAPLFTPKVAAAEPPAFPAPVHVPAPAPVAPPASVHDLFTLDSGDEEQEDEPAPLFDDAVEPLPAPKTKGPGKAKSGRSTMIAAAAAIVAIAAGGGWYAMRGGAGAAAAGNDGTLDVKSNPAGVAIVLDGEPRGQTPATFTVAAGPHILELHGRGTPRVIPITVTAGAQLSQYLEMPDAAPSGQLEVQSEPAGATVTVDGTEWGVTPATVTGLEPGTHEVVLKSGAGTVRQTVTVQAGVNASLVVPIGSEAPAGPVSGWVSVRAPVRVDISEDGRLLGTSESDRVMLASGRHELQLSNDTLGYRERRNIQVAPGKVAQIAIEFPDGVINLNASPWAEVFIDGQRVGETPIGNLKIPIGPHEVVFRHPELGEKKHAVSVTLGGPVRLSVDMK